MKKTIFSKYFLVVLWLTVSTSNSFSCKQNEEKQPPAQVFEREVNERIKKYRKEDVVIRIIRNGQPVRDAMVDVKMLSHEFLFGSTRGFAAVSDNNNTLFAGLFNFATLPTMTVLSDKGEQWQAEEVVRIYTMLFSHPAVEAITWWDFTDLDSWTKAPAGLLHADDTPKLAYHALKRLIKETLATNITLKTDENGEVHLRAFRGKYRLDVTTPNDVKIASQYRTIQKGNSLIELNLKCYQCD